jgi:hypothetical protein
MAVSYTAVVKNARLDALAARLNAGSGPAKIKVYSGSVPANADAALGGATLLGTLTCSDPVAAAASGGVLTFSAITADTAADATGTASFFRATDSDDTVCVQGSAGTSGADLNLTTTSIVIGGEIEVTSLVITSGN